MKKIINNRKYDTETAKEIFTAGSKSLGCNDMSWWTETLYKKETGEFFIYGKGGAMSKWSSPHGNNIYGPGDGIEPLTEQEAREWVKEHANHSYEDIFGEVSE